MSFKNNLSELRSYIKQAPDDNKSKIKDVIKLYEEKKIPNIKTALNATKLLASKHKSTIKSGKAEREYNSIMNKYGFNLPMTGRLSRPPDDSMSYGSDDKFGLTLLLITIHVVKMLKERKQEA